MESCKLLYEVNQRLNEIFSPLKNMSFDRKSVLVYWDFYPLPQLQAKSVFMFNNPETT